ncbi:hypothetical protein OSB04_018320 [Centaurea solstitialis]|uniref:Uncharacterized protein n=1 Tax=Centaurea solstitialis TaxID=347529 RepID=A0AA38TGF0_9ASTR|nr:hypothetical protein OSB04_018320 [Centaurea solstitialis]
MEEEELSPNKVKKKSRVTVEEWSGSSSSKLSLTAVISPSSSSSPSSFALKRHGNRFNIFPRRFLEAFVPEGFPSSVTPDYIPFQTWDLLQALLSAIGVGEKSATVIGATFQWFLRDLTGMLGGVMFTFYQGSNLDSDAKMWRLVADLMNDLGIDPNADGPSFSIVPFGIYIHCLYRELVKIFHRPNKLCALGLHDPSLHSVSLAGVASGATRAALTQHFALQNNAADISAKEGSQETVATMMGMALGMLLAHITMGHSMIIWLSFLSLTMFHMYANYKAVRCLNLTTLNCERSSILLLHFMETGRGEECYLFLLFSLSKRGLSLGARLTSMDKFLELKAYQTLVCTAIVASMETRGQQARLDQHDEQLKQLQADVSEIKEAIKRWESDRADEEEFRALVMSWAKQQGKQPMADTVVSSTVAGTSPTIPIPVFPSTIAGTSPTIPIPFFPSPSMGGVQSPFIGSGVHTHLPQFHEGVTSLVRDPFVSGPPLGVMSGLPWAAKKVKLPEFSGFDPRGWITKAELFFEIHGTPPELRICLAQLSMTGVAQHWFSVVKGIYDPLNWDQLKRELLQRFSGLEIQNPYEQLSTIQQVSSIYDYIDDFEYLLSLVPRLPESQALGYFLAGLRPEVKRWVRLHRPLTRLDAMYLAKDVEEMLNPSDHSALTARYRYQFPPHNSDASLPGSLMHPGGQHVSKNQTPYSIVDRRPLVSGSGQNRREGFTDLPGSISVDRGTSPRLESSGSPSMSRSPSLTSVDSSSVGGRNRGFRSLTRTEWEERRKKGLCFRCGQIFGPAHKCPEGSMRVLVLADDEHLDAEGAIRAMDAWEEAETSKIRVPDTSLEDKTLIAGGTKYMLLEKKGIINVVMHKDSTTGDVLQGFMHALVMANFLDDKPTSLHMDSQTWMDKHYEAFVLKLLSSGWKTERLLSSSIIWRANWSHGLPDKKIN